MTASRQTLNILSPYESIESIIKNYIDFMLMPGTICIPVTVVVRSIADSRLHNRLSQERADEQQLLL